MNAMVDGIYFLARVFKGDAELPQLRTLFTHCREFLISPWDYLEDAIHKFFVYLRRMLVAFTPACLQDQPITHERRRRTNERSQTRVKGIHSNNRGSGDRSDITRNNYNDDGRRSVREARPRVMHKKSDVKHRRHRDIMTQTTLCSGVRLSVQHERPGDEGPGEAPSTLSYLIRTLAMALDPGFLLLIVLRAVLRFTKRCARFLFWLADECSLGIMAWAFPELAEYLGIDISTSVPLTPREAPKSNIPNLGDAFNIAVQESSSQLGDEDVIRHWVLSHGDVEQDERLVVYEERNAGRLVGQPRTREWEIMMDNFFSLLSLVFFGVLIPFWFYRSMGIVFLAILGGP
ncbi:uncharacterized protein LOC116620094 isoform X1 [Nematostella vectensis]|uniref:uncharacterized protein LOC116620094 isoform X1 n=1 Tax=Nematostella vectensis TaxID=45351 RepID=UPI002077473C|nr:uncharacterized protein LOC116620094 isoform X1 [Nematostella vectensis]